MGGRARDTYKKIPALPRPPLPTRVLTKENLNL